jgi:hypothetical protein
MSLIIFAFLLLQAGIAGATGHLWNIARTSSATSSSSLFLALPSADPASVMIEAVRLRVRAHHRARHEEWLAARRWWHHVWVQQRRASLRAADSNWQAIAMCESGVDWHINSGNGFWGGLQFTPRTWFAFGGGWFDGTGPFPYSATQQMAVARRVLAAQGPGAWPNCFFW